MQRRLFDSDDYLFGSDFVFRDRFDGEPAYFDGMVKDLGHYKGGGTAMRTNFVPDLMSLSLRSRPIRGAETTGGGIDFPNCRHLAVHLNEYPPGYGPLTHRHRNEALIYWLHGSGYSEVWKNFEGPRDRLQWHAKQVVAPPTFWYHRHQLDQDTGARLVAVTTNKFQFQTNYWEIEGGPNSGLG
jgi:hypothetical protein